MSFAPANAKPIGYFVEKDYSNPFEFIVNDTPEIHPFPHKIFVGDQTRFADVRKTVAYVVVDETATGFVVHKWNIKNCRRYV